MGVYTSGPLRPEDGGVYPLEEEGTYGRVPRRPHPGKSRHLLEAREKDQDVCKLCDKE